eukprot:TRINITY_DN24995_c0_g1_i2.p1 TRINITY_DN24995_c0_g1~~TRINITY_DN24995_c0_g1_i2.p1  ORF type:complete len:301 (-),score=56.54 TRINITY_DN24995_c0_g1_i2:75-956(-)
MHAAIPEDASDDHLESARRLAAALRAAGVAVCAAAAAELRQLLLDARLAAALAAQSAAADGAAETVGTLARPLTSQAVALPVLSPAAVGLLEAEARVAFRSRPGLRRHLLTRFDLDTGRAISPSTSLEVAAAHLYHEVLPHLLPLLPSGATSPLCTDYFAYVLRYSMEDSQQDGGRVFRCHVDDSDVTLAICLGESSGCWKGADLVYVAPDEGPDGEPLPRPGTPDLAHPSTRQILHAHELGTGVLHAGEAYHMVTPLREGERFSLVLFGMSDDAEYKRTFYRELFQESQDAS